MSNYDYAKKQLFIIVKVNVDCLFVNFLNTFQKRMVKIKFLMFFIHIYCTRLVLLHYFGANVCGVYLYIPQENGP